jgi:2,4-dienoyl-CoA reductase (NADPH2)
VLPRADVLFTPFQLGPHLLINRLVALPVFSGYALPDGRVSDLMIAHYTALARTGAAMVVVANAAVTAEGVVAVNNLRIDRDEFIPGLARLARAIKDNGAVAALQLNHGGRFGKTARPLSPSALDTAHIPFNIGSLREFMNFFPLEQRPGLTRDFMQRVAAWTRSMGAGEKEAVVVAFGAAAARAHAAGFDAVELHGATGYLLTQFLSGFNAKDATGAPLRFEDRIRFPLQVVREVKHLLPAGFPVGYRLLLREWVPGGIDLAEALALAERLEAEGIAYLSPSAATYHSMFLPEVRAITSRSGYLKEDCIALKRRAAVPVIVSGRVLTPVLAEEMLAEGAGDLVGLGRGLRVDPRWLAKALSGQRVTVCRNCSLCLRRVVLDQGFVCSRWPRLEQERVDFEQRLLKRGTGKVLWVIDGPEDMQRMLAPHAAAMVPAGAGVSTTVLFLEPEVLHPGYEREKEVFLDHCRAARSRTGEELDVAASPGPAAADRVVDREIERGGYGTIILARRQGADWRERLLYRHRAKAISLIGIHPRWGRVLVPLDLGLASLFVLRNLQRTLVGSPEVEIDVIHVLQGAEVQARKRWSEMLAVLGWTAPVALRLLPLDGSVAETVLRELEEGDFGTIVMGKRGLSRMKRLFLGSVSAAVLKGSGDRTMVLVD